MHLTQSWQFGSMNERVPRAYDDLERALLEVLKKQSISNCVQDELNFSHGEKASRPTDNKANKLSYYFILSENSRAL